MHWYKRNIGEYYKKAGRLSMIQHGAYNMLIDSCYDREQFPTFDEAMEWTWASTEEEKQAVKFVLGRFFTLVGDVYEHSRINEEVEKYQSNSNTNKRIAREREAKRREERTKRERDDNEAPPKQETVNSKQETSNTKQEPIVETILECRFDEFWLEFKDSRAKSEALKKWKTLKLDNIADEIIDGAKKYVKARGSDKKYWKQASGWLNGKRWEDDLSGFNESGKKSTDEQIDEWFGEKDYIDGEVVDEQSGLL